MTEQSNVISINGVDYNENDLEPTQQYLVMQIKDLQSQRQTFQFKLDQCQAALQAMTNDLISSVENKTDEPEAVAS